VSDSVADYTATLPTKRMGSAVLFTDAQDRMLLVEPTYKDYWEIPGGCVDADESPYDAAVRELKEELALSIAPGRLLVVDWVPPSANRTEGVMFVYDGGTLTDAHTAEIHLPAEELRSWRWCTAKDAADRLSDLLVRRAQAGLRARSLGQTLYLENGVQVA
jgi:8-oxo-dGTP diphosphatase